MMGKPIMITKQEAIDAMEENLRRIKACSDLDTFLVLSYDLSNNRSLGGKRLNKNSGTKLMGESNTFVLNMDKEEDSISILSIYSEKQVDIVNILPIGLKHDMFLIPQLEIS